MWYAIGIVYVMALVFVLSMLRVAGQYDEDMENLMSEEMMPTDMITRARAQAVVDAWFGGE